jgi:uncharacterized membrane protein YgcG
MLIKKFYLPLAAKFSLSRSNKIVTHGNTLVQQDIAGAVKKPGQCFLAFTLACVFSLYPTHTVRASESDILAEDEPKVTYYIDDASQLSRTARDEINNQLADLETRTGYKLVVVTTRKLEFDPDAFSFSEKVFKKWHRSDGGDKNGLLLVITAGKDGALIGGNSFTKAVGDDLIDSVVGDNIPYYTEEEKFNEATLSSINRIVNVLDGKNDPGAPRRIENTRKRTYKTKEETDRVKPVTGTIVVTLLLIAFVVPMLQFYGYVSKD